MIDHPSPPEILRALDTQLRDYLSFLYGGHDTALRNVPQLDTEGAPGTILTILINRYEEIVQHGALNNDALLRQAIIASGILDLSRTDRCSRAQLRAMLSLLGATEVPGFPECPTVMACRAEIEGCLGMHHGA